MSDLEAKYRVSLSGQDQLEGFFQRSEAGAKRSAQAMTESFRRASDGIKDRANEIGRSLLMIGGLGAGIGIAESARNVLELRAQVTQLGATAGLSKDQLAALTERIHETSTAANQLGGDVTSALQAFKDKGGNIEEGAKNLLLYGRVATATGIAMADVARAGADFQKLGVGQAAGFGIFAKQRDLLGVAPRLLSAFESGGIQGEEGLQKAVAFSRSVKGVLGDPEATRNAVEMAFQNIGEKGDQLQAEGIQVFDPKTHEARNRVDVILDVIRKAKGRQDILARIFGGRVLKGLNPLAAEFRETGGFGSLDRFESESGGADTIDQMFEANRHTGLGEIKASKIAIEQSADRRLGGLAESFAAHSGLIASALDHPLLAGGAFLGGKKLLGMAGGGLERWALGRATGAGGGESIGQALTGGDRVFVTNWPSGGLLSGGADGAAAAEKTGEAIANKAGLGVLPRILASLSGGGAAAIVAGTVAGVATSLTALVAATAPLNEKRQQIEDETRRHLENSAIVQRENTERNAASQVSLGIRTFGSSGGRITTSQAALAAKQGIGSYGLSARKTLDEFKAQQLTLRQLAAGERLGLGDEVLGADVEGGGFLLRALAASNPEFRKAKTGKERAAILERLAGANEDDVRKKFRDFSATPTTSPTGPTPFGPEAPSFVDRLVDKANLSELGSILRDSLGLHFVINVDPNAATVESDRGTRSPDVLVTRGGA